MGWEGWKRECGEGCDQTKWPDVALDLVGAAEQGDAHGTREAGMRGQGTIQSKPIPLHLSR
jgi:hypothetical protein